MDAPADMPPNARQVSLRLPAEAVERAGALVPALAALPAYRAFRLERATVFRLALEIGLESLERENLTPAAKPAKHARAK